MNTRFIFTALFAIIALAAIAACGGNGDNGNDAGAIRIQKGLAVAAVGANSNSGAQSQSLGAPVPASGQSNGSFTGVASTGGAANVTSDRAAYGGGAAPQVYPYPAQQVGTNGITVQGYASASASADSAIAEFYFSSNGAIGIGGKPLPFPYPSGGVYEPTPAPLPQVTPVTEASLQPVIGALVAAGVSRDDIKFLNAYADLYSSSATLRATVKNIDSLDAVTKAATDAAAGLSGIILQNSNVSYTVNDCSKLETAATKAAVEDAGARAGSFAQALGVGLGSVTGASNFSSFGGTPCDNGYFGGPYAKGAVGYFPGQPREVQVYANISVTYAIK